MFGSGSHYTVPASIPAGCSLTASDKLSVSHIVLQELRRLLPLWGSCPPSSPTSASTATSLPGSLLLFRLTAAGTLTTRKRPAEPTSNPHSTPPPNTDVNPTFPRDYFITRTGPPQNRAPISSNGRGVSRGFTSGGTRQGGLRKSLYTISAFLNQIQSFGKKLLITFVC